MQATCLHVVMSFRPILPQTKIRKCVLSLKETHARNVNDGAYEDAPQSLSTSLYVSFDSKLAATGTLASSILQRLYSSQSQHITDCMIRPLLYTLPASSAPARS